MNTTHKIKAPTGFVPREWSIRKLGELAHISYGISDALEKGLKGGVRIVAMPNVTKVGDFDWSTVYFVEPAKVTDKVRLLPGDILFNWRNGSKDHLGKSALFDKQGVFSHVGFLLKIRAGKHLVPAYLDAFLKQAKINGYFLTAKQQVNNTFNKEELSTVPIAYPSIPEQRKIAEILRTWDEAIEACERLRFKKIEQATWFRTDLAFQVIGASSLWLPF